ncbi:MAG: single-stranded DNA-binding protein [Cytophagales bacterium]|nr:single-stranded DNA-binding protein [Cytophagales bacterium]
MMSVNKVILIGNLGADPEVRALENGVKVARLSIATTEVYRDKTTGEKRENTEWHRVVAWRGLAEISENYLKKGHKVYVEGKLRTSSYEDNGITKYSTEVVAQNMTMLTPRDGATSPTTPSSPDNVTPQPPIEKLITPDDDLPF